MNLDRPLAPAPYSTLPPVPSFALTSQDVADGATLAAPFTEAGGDVSPHLAWSGLPEGTRSLVVTCHDPDAPSSPGGFWHWAVANLPATLTSLPRGAGSPDGAALPPGAVHALNDAGTVGYTGAAPPRGDRVHRYGFAVHALDVERLDVTARTHASAVLALAVPHTLARAVVVPTFQR